MDRQAYDRYLAMFNARDYDGILSHFADRFELHFAGYVFRTPEEVKRFYAFLHSHVDEQISVSRYVSDGETVALEAVVKLTGKRNLEAPDLEAAGYTRLVTLPASAVVEIPQFIHYHLKDGKIVKAVCAVLEPPVA